MQLSCLNFVVSLADQIVCLVSTVCYHSGNRQQAKHRPQESPVHAVFIGQEKAKWLAINV